MGFSVEFSDSQLRILAERMGRRAAVRTYKVAEFAAKEMEDEVVRIVAAEFINDRPAHRSRGTMPLIESFEGVVIGTRGELPVRAVLRTRRGADLKKVGAHEYGSDAHTIAPSGVGVLKYPKGYDKWTQAHGKNNFKTFEPVEHPGTEATGMMRRARGAVAQRVQRYAYTIR